MDHRGVTCERGVERSAIIERGHPVLESQLPRKRLHLGCIATSEGRTKPAIPRFAGNEPPGVPVGPVEQEAHRNSEQ
jgi:hypothetical protein